MTNRVAQIHQPNRLLEAERTAREWSLDKAAWQLIHVAKACDPKRYPEFSAARRQISRLEKGQTKSPKEDYRKWIGLLYQKSPDYFFGAAAEAAPAGELCDVTSHKFIQVYAGAGGIRDLIDHFQLTPDNHNDRQVGAVAHPAGPCTLYAYPFGTAVFHLEEQTTWACLAELAVWRQRSYREVLTWAADLVESIVTTGPPAELREHTYVLTVFWLNTALWTGPTLDTAVRVLSMPRVLLDTTVEDEAEALGRAVLTERSVLAKGLERDEISFGAGDAGIGYASWSGVAYHPLAASRALSPKDIVDVEVKLQAVWAYCYHLNSAVRRGRDPEPVPGYDWRYLRGVRATLSTPGALESGERKMMRVAIVQSSEVLDQLAQAIDALKDAV